MQGKIYLLRCPLTNEIRYIGQTAQELIVRLSQHCRDCTQNKEKNGYKNRWLKKVYREHGLKPSIELIEQCNLDILNERERYWIDYYFNQGCRLTNTSGKMYFRNFNRKMSAGNSKLIHCYDKEHNYLLFDNARRASEKLNIDYKVISASAVNKEAQKNYVFSFVELNKEEVENRFLNCRNLSNIISQNLKTGEEILFKSQQEAATYFNCNFRNINQVLKGLRYSCAGNLFKYEEEEFKRIEKKSASIKVKNNITGEIYSNFRECCKITGHCFSYIKLNLEKNKNLFSYVRD